MTKRINLVPKDLFHRTPHGARLICETSSHASFNARRIFCTWIPIYNPAYSEVLMPSCSWAELPKVRHGSIFDLNGGFLHRKRLFDPYVMIKNIILYVCIGASVSTTGVVQRRHRGDSQRGAVIFASCDSSFKG